MSIFAKVSSRLKIIGASIVLLLVILVGGLAALAVYKPIAFADLAWRTSQIVGLTGLGAQDFEHAVFLLTPGTTDPAAALYGGLFTVSTKNLKLDTSSSVLDMARQGSTMAVIVHDSHGYEVNVSGAVLASSATEKSSVALSPDESMVAYAETTTATSTDTNSNDWVVQVIAVNGGKTIRTVPAFKVFFIDNKNLLAFTSAGIESVNLQTGALSVNSGTPFPSTLINVAQTKDRTIIAWNSNSPGINHTPIMKISNSNPLELTPLAEANPPAGASLSVSPTALYALTPGLHNSLITYPYSAGHIDVAKRRLYTFPLGIHMTKLVL